MTATAPAARATTPRARAAWGGLGGAVADLGVLVPILVALVMVNGMSATAALLPAGLLYAVAGWYYRLPVPVQPLKAFGVLAVALGLGLDVVAAGALLMGLTFAVLGATGMVDRAARWVPRPVVRGVQLSVGLLFLRLAWSMVTHPPRSFRPLHLPVVLSVAAALTVAALAVLLRRRGVAVVLVLAGLAVALATLPGSLALGPAPWTPVHPGWHAFWTAAMLLVLPQLPLTFANSCVATADAATTYFGDAGRRVRPGRLAVSLGLANLAAGAIGGMPVCHGAGGLTAHREFGARTGRATAGLGAVLVLLALVAGSGLGRLLAGFPVPLLAGMLAAAGLLHIALLRDLRGPLSWAVAVAVGVIGVVWNLAPAMLLGIAVWWLARRIAPTHTQEDPCPRPSTPS